MVRPLEAFRVAGLPSDAGAEIRDFDLKKYSLPKFWSALRKTRNIWPATSSLRSRRHNWPWWTPGYWTAALIPPAWESTWGPA